MFLKVICCRGVRKRLYVGKNYLIIIITFYQGTMLLRTRCFSCDTSTERQEDFQDISVPVRVEKEDEDSDTGIFILLTDILFR